MKIAKIDEVLKSVCSDDKVRQVILRVMEYERSVITLTMPHFKDELDAIIEEVLRQ